MLFPSHVSFVFVSERRTGGRRRDDVPHGAQSDAVGEVGVRGQQREEEEAREGVRGRGARVRVRAQARGGAARQQRARRARAHARRRLALHALQLRDQPLLLHTLVTQLTEFHKPRSYSPRGYTSAIVKASRLASTR